MNSEIEELFKDFKIDDKKIPVAFLRYRGKENTFITYQEIDNNPALEGDDMPLYSVSSFDFDVYTNGNYLKIVSEIKKIMLQNGYVLLPDGNDSFEEDTRLYHKTISFAKERCVIEWQE